MMKGNGFSLTFGFASGEGESITRDFRPQILNSREKPYLITGDFRVFVSSARAFWGVGLGPCVFWVLARAFLPTRLGLKRS
jgi:hypothetical protein